MTGESRQVVAVVEKQRSNQITGVKMEKYWDQWTDQELLEMHGVETMHALESDAVDVEDIYNAVYQDAYYELLAEKAEQCDNYDTELVEYNMHSLGLSWRDFT